MKIIPLSEGSFTVDNTKLFIPFNQQSENLQARPAGSLLVEIQPFVVITHNDILLLDTGLGFSDKDGKMQLDETKLTTAFNKLVQRFGKAEKAYRQDLARASVADRERAAFLAAVSHELRTPMTSIRGYVDVLLMGAAGALNELRKGISLEEDGKGPVSLEEYFIHIVGGTRSTGEEEVLQWLT